MKKIWSALGQHSPVFLDAILSFFKPLGRGDFITFLCVYPGRAGHEIPKIVVFEHGEGEKMIYMIAGAITNLLS